MTKTDERLAKHSALTYPITDLATSAASWLLLFIVVPVISLAGFLLFSAYMWTGCLTDFLRKHNDDCI